MLVDLIFKGTAPAEITVTSGNTVNVYDHEPRYVWIGPSGACGAFGDDPTDKYAIIGLTNAGDGTYGAFVFSWFFAGAEPAGEKYDRAMSHLASRGLTPRNPDEPSRPAGSPADRAIPTALLAGATLVVLAIGAAAVLRRRSGG
jgi:hypothetical protein